MEKTNEIFRMTLYLPDDADEFVFQNLDEDILYDVLIEINYEIQEITYVILEKTEDITNASDSIDYEFDNFNDAVTHLKELHEERQENYYNLMYELYKHLFDVLDFETVVSRIISEDRALLYYASSFYKRNFEYSPKDDAIFNDLKKYLQAELEQLSQKPMHKKQLKKLGLIKHE